MLSCHSITNGSTNLFNLIKKIRSFPHTEACKIATNVIRNNAFICHPESILISMPGDQDKRVRKIAVQKIIDIRKEPLSSDGGPVVITKFMVSPINFHASAYYKLVNFNESNVIEPPLTKNLTDEEVQYFVTEPIRFKHPCHSQAVKRHMRLVTEASRVASTFKRRDVFLGSAFVPRN